MSVNIIEFELKGMSMEEFCRRHMELADDASPSVKDPEKKKSPIKDAGQNKVQGSSMSASMETMGSSKDESASDNFVFEEVYHDILNKAVVDTSERPQKDEKAASEVFDSFGKTVAEEMKLLPESSSFDAMKEIQDILLKYHKQLTLK